MKVEKSKISWKRISLATIIILLIVFVCFLFLNFLTFNRPFRPGLDDMPGGPNTTRNYYCGGVAGTICPPGYECKLYKIPGSTAYSEAGKCSKSSN